MNAPANIYSAIVFDLHPRISGYLDELNKAGQIDLDGDGYPYVIAVQKQGPNHVCQIVRNGNQENFILNTRKKRDPICSWDQNDGYVRRGGKRVIQIDTGVGAASQPRPERKKRTMESFRRLVGQILKDDDESI